MSFKVVLTRLEVASAMGRTALLAGEPVAFSSPDVRVRDSGLAAVAWQNSTATTSAPSDKMIPPRSRSLR
ncbi:hypothetical protein CCHR01_16531 [Colletotrichum chrysophilum]|uniref:Uncharacterized protein n=1 Tax=Colletotrichum chrysophilum TaxID=1836956 RepID=A0AAD9A471_9PEZI|nr:hypothetical protein CCHR01_16531 [Colletotrichum chrysophilum]